MYMHVGQNRVRVMGNRPGVALGIEGLAASILAEAGKMAESTKSPHEARFGRWRRRKRYVELR